MENVKVLKMEDNEGKGNSYLCTKANRLTTNNLSYIGEGRITFLDFLKGLAIIAVVLYHFGTLKYGYLGVDLFLVINGYLVTNSILKAYIKGNFSYFSFIFKRIIRLWPLLLLASLVSLSIGYFNMLPDDLENLGESVVASNLFANNILMSITGKDYWDTSQLYKALMHTWYIGILIQFYIIYPLVVMISQKWEEQKKINKSLFWIILALSIVSFICYITTDTKEVRFYYIHCRFFELALGGLIAIAYQNNWLEKIIYCTSIRITNWICVFSLIILFTLKIEVIPSQLKLLLAVALSCISVICSMNHASIRINSNTIYKAIVSLGIASYSIYIWHQVVLAFYRYIINSEPSFIDNFYCLVIIAIISFLSYYLIEKPLTHISGKKTYKLFVGCILLCVVTGVTGFLIYLNAGVVRDVPELDIYTNNIRRGMHAEYNDRVKKMNVDFGNSDKIKVLVIGDSFGRDWVNILLESDIKDSLNISYTGHADSSCMKRVEQADYIFMAFSNGMPHTYPDYLKNYIKSDTKVYWVGTKRYGTTNGNVYRKRFRDDYLQSTVSYATIADMYEEQKKLYGKYYIDFIAPVLRKDGNVSAFTDDGKYISQDCRHLTRGGAKYYARIFNLKTIFSIK